MVSYLRDVMALSHHYIWFNRSLLFGSIGRDAQYTTSTYEGKDRADALTFRVG